MLDIPHRHSAGVSGLVVHAHPDRTGRRWPIALPGCGVKAPARPPGHYGSRRDPTSQVHGLGRAPPPGVAARLGGRLAPPSSPRYSLKPGGQAPLQGLPWCRAGRRPSAPVIVTCPAPDLLQQPIQSPAPAHLGNHIPPISTSPVVVLTNSHQCQPFQRKRPTQTIERAPKGSSWLGRAEPLAGLVRRPSSGRHSARGLVQGRRKTRRRRLPHR